MAKVKIILNGEEKFVDQGATLLDLISELELNVKKIAIEKDLEVISSEKFSTTAIDEGARIEIVHFIGGG